MSITHKKTLIEPKNQFLSVSRQCDLLGLARSTFYYEVCQESTENLVLMRLMDEVYFSDPTKGARLLHQDLLEKGFLINLKRVRRLMKKMGLEAIYPKPNLSKGDTREQKYPYLLKNKVITSCNQVWATDITYIPMKKGFLYLVAIIDWHSRFILSWRLSNTLQVDFCLDCLQEALDTWGTPEIFNTDQGSQFTCIDWIKVLKDNNIQISMDGKGRALDNIIIERFWRTIKYRYIYLHAFESSKELYTGIQRFMQLYNYENKHQSLAYYTPAQVYIQKLVPSLKNAKNTLDNIIKHH
jgi:putative transposase